MSYYCILLSSGDLQSIDSNRRVCVRKTKPKCTLRLFFETKSSFLVLNQPSQVSVCNFSSLLYLKLSIYSISSVSQIDESKTHAAQHLKPLLLLRSVSVSVQCMRREAGREMKISKIQNKIQHSENFEKKKRSIILESQHF